MYIPALFACLAHEMIPNVKGFHAESGFFANGLHQIVYTLHSVALALETVYQNTSVFHFARPTRIAMHLSIEMRMNGWWPIVQQAKASRFSLQSASLCSHSTQKRNRTLFRTRKSPPPPLTLITLFRSLSSCLLLHSVCGGSLSIEQLEEIGLTPTRVKSAQISAQKRHAGNLDAAPSPLTSQ